MNKSTGYYVQRGKQKLAYDLYRPEGQDEQKQKLIIMLHSGDFSSGARDSERETKTCEHLCQQGYVVASMDYRLGLSNQPFLPSNIIQAVRQGVEDLIAMTLHAISHAVEWMFSPNHIIICCTGAGAVIALTTEYELCNERINALPREFNYSCIVANTGAIATGERDLSLLHPFCPVIFIQSKNDSVVPSGRFFVPGLLLVGGQHLYQFISATGAQCMYYDMSKLAPNVLGTTWLDSLDFFIKQGLENLIAV